jgi:uncharacterized protein
VFFQRKPEETALHIAVLYNDHKRILQLREDEELLQEKNSLGFTALEIARLLGKTKCIEILQPEPKKTIKIAQKGENLYSEYSLEQFEQFFKIKLLQRQLFKDYAFLKEVIKQCPWVLKWSPSGEANRSLGKRYQEELSQAHTPDMTIRWIHEDISYGVYTNDALEAGDYIGEYTGSVRELDPLSPDHNSYCLQYPTSNWSKRILMVDAQKGGNILRFINHSDEPNLSPVCLLDRGLLHLVFLAGSSISKGSHLTVDYGKDYWLKREKHPLS